MWEMTVREGGLYNGRVSEVLSGDWVKEVRHGLIPF